MIDALSEVQVSTEQLNKMTSIAEIQNKGIKRRFNDDDKSWLKKVDVTTLKSLSLCREDQEFAINSVKGSRKRRRLLATMFPADKEKRKIGDPNIVGMDVSYIYYFCSLLFHSSLFYFINNFLVELLVEFSFVGF